MTKLPRCTLLGVAVPLLIATATFAQTPEATNPPASTEAETPEQKAHRERMDELQRRIDEFTKQKALNDARASAATSALGPLGSYEGAEGNVNTSDTDHGKMEATLLSSLALREAANELGARLCQVARASIREHRDHRNERGGLSAVELSSVDSACEPNTRALPPAPLQLPETAVRPASDAQWPELCDALNFENQPQDPPVVRPIVIVPESQTGFVDLAEAFNVRSLGVGRQMCAAIRAGDGILGRPIRDLHGAGRGELFGGSVAGVSAIVSTVANLLRSDYSIFGLDVTTDEDLLVRELARAVMASGVPNPVYAPSLFPASTARIGNPVLRRLEVLDALRAASVDVMAALQGRVDAIEGALANAAGERAARLQLAKGEHDPLLERLRGAIKAYDDTVTELTTPQQTQPPAIAAIIRQAHTAELLRRGALLTVTDINFMGGTAYTQRNFFTFLGGMPYHVSGGVLVSYSVHDGQTGQVRDAIAVPVAGGYVRPTRLRRALGRR